MKGRPQYVRYSTAWPDLPIRGTDSRYDEINVSFDHRDGGTYGAFTFGFYDFGRGNLAVRVEAFDDGLGALADSRVQAVIARLRRARKSPTAETFMGWLEAEGIRANPKYATGLEAAA